MQIIPASQRFDANGGRVAEVHGQVFLNAAVVMDTPTACRAKKKSMPVLSIASSFTLAGQPVIRPAVGSDRVDSSSGSSAAVSLSKNAQARLESEERFEKYQSRINQYMRNFFTADDRRVIGEAYEIAEKKERDLTKIDKLVYELGAFRIQQHMRGELVMAVVNQSRDKDDQLDAPPRTDLAHLPLLGEIRKMNGAGG